MCLIIIEFDKKNCFEKEINVNWIKLLSYVFLVDNWFKVMVWIGFLSFSC